MSELQTENISPFTGLPITPKDKKPEVSPLTGLPITNRAVRDGVLGNVLGQAASGNVNLLDQMSYKDYESYKSYGVAVLPGGDWDEQRAQNQWRLEKWAYGLTKAGVTAATSFAENTVGLVVGLGSVASGGSFFDNSFGRGLDKVNEWMAETLPNYYTREEQNATVLGGALYANFWADKVANGVGYVVGSLATDVALAYLTGGTSLAGTAARYAAKFGGVLSKAQKAQAISNVYKLTNAVQQGGKVADILTDGARASTKFKSLRGARTAYGRAESGFISALGESNVEARQAKNETLAILKQQYALQNGIEEDEIPANILAEMEETATTAGNVVFGINLPTVGLTNMITIGRMLGPGYKRSLQKAAQERAKKSIFNIGVGKEADEFVDLGLQGNFAKRAFVKGARKYGDNFTSAISESAQEATQFFASKYAQDYYTNKYFGRAEGIDGMLDSAMYGLRETFGSKEGLESALLGGIIGGGTVSVRNLNRMRKGEQSLYDIKTKNTQAVLDIVNSTNGVADAVERAKSADTSNKLAQAMDKLIKVASDPTVDKATRDRAHKEFKDLQYQLVANEAFTLLEFGREDILMQQLDDAKDMDETEFKKAFGYDVNQPLPEGGKAAIVDKIKDRIKEHKQIKEKIEELAPRLERTTGLPRSLMSKEQREQEDQLVEANNFYRRALYNRASAISGYNTRSNSIGKDMQKLASDNGVSLNRTAMEDYEFDQLEIEFEDNDEVKVQDGGKVKGKLVEELQKVYKELQSKNPLAAKEFAVLAQDYLHLVAERQATVNSFEALTGDQGLERSEYIRKRQEAMEAEAEKKKAEAEANQVINNAETAKDIENNLPANASKEQKEIAKAKAKKLQKEAIKRAKKYEGKTLDELREIDRDALEKLPDGAIELAALDIAINKAKKQTAQPAQPVAEPEVEEAFKPENVGGVQIVSANSREFVINGKVFYNYSSDPLAAINRDPNGNIISVTLVDENLESRTFRNEETADALAYAILTGEYNPPSVPTLTESIEEDVEIRTEVAIESAEKLERKAELPQNAPEVSPVEAIKAQLFELHSDLEESAELISERHAILREQGVTLKKNRMRDEEIKALTYIQKKLEKEIIARKNELAKLKADKVTKEVTKQDAEERLKKLQVEIAKLDDEIAEFQALELRLEEGGVQTQSLVNVKQARRKKQAAKNKLTKELLTIQNEEIDSTRDARQTAERLAGKAQEQANEGEGANTTPGPGGEGRVVTDRQSRTEQAADELEKAERNASGELRDQGAGQARGVKPDQVIIQAPAIQAPAAPVSNIEANELTEEEADLLYNNLRQITEKYNSSTLADSIDPNLKTPLTFGDTTVTAIEPSAGDKSYIWLERPTGKWLISIDERDGKQYLTLSKLNDKGTYYAQRVSEEKLQSLVDESGLRNLIDSIYQDTNIKQPKTRRDQFQAQNALQQKYGLKRTYKDIVRELAALEQPVSDKKAKKAELINQLLKPSSLQSSTIDKDELERRDSGKQYVDAAIKAGKSDKVIELINLAANSRSAATIAKETGFSDNAVRAIREYLGIPPTGGFSMFGAQTEDNPEDLDRFNAWKKSIDDINAELKALEGQSSAQPQAGVEISSNAKGLAAALTNPTELAKSKGNLSKSYPIEFNGKTYIDVEAAYQALKDKSEAKTKPTKENSKNYKLMVDLIKAKLQQHPRLVTEITNQGGAAWILSSTHQPTKQNTVWETGGQNWFIESLADAYNAATQPTAEAIPAQQLRPQSGLDIAVLPSNFETAEASPSSVYVNEDGTLPMSSPASQTVNGAPIIIEDGDLYDFNDDFVGKTVTFEVREDTDWAKEQSNLGWKNAPIYVVLNGRRIGLLQGYNEQTGKGTARESIYNLYKQGKTPTATTTGRGAFSFLNAIDPETGKSSFVNPLEEFESPVFAVITSEAKQIRYTIGEGATVSEAELSKMQSDLDEQASKLDRDKLVEGQVVMVVKTPNGKYTTYPVSTQNLSSEDVKLAMKLMSEGKTTELLDLVGFNADPFNWGSIAQGKPSFLYYIEAGNFFVFHSDSAGQLVSINPQELQKAMAGQKFSFGFVLGPTDPDSDKFDKDEKRKDHASIGKNIVNDLSSLLSRKKYQVSKESVNNPTARIVNPETGQSQNYQEYIFGNGLARVDTRNNKGTVFHGLQIKFGGIKAEGGPVNTKATETTTYEKPATPAKETVQRTEGKKEGRKKPAAKPTQVVSLSELGAQPSPEVMKQLMEEMQGNPVQDLASLVGQSAPKSSGIKVLNQKELNDLIDLGDELNNQCK